MTIAPRPLVRAQLAIWGMMTLLAGVASLHAQSGPPSNGRSATATVENDSAEVARTVDRYHAALAAGDTASVSHLLTADAVILESGGVESRAEYLSHHLPADIAFARAVRRERGPVRVKVSGGTAWATSTATTRGEYRGQPVNSVGAELMVLTRASGGWRISAIHWSSRNVRP